MPVTVNPRTVLRIIDRLNIGGPAIHVTLLNQYLDQARFNEHAWKSILVYGQEEKNEGNMLALLRQSQQTVYLPALGRELHPLKDLVSFWRVFRLIRQQKPAIVHTHKSKAGVIGRLTAWICRVPVRVHTYHGHVLHGYFGPWKSRIFIWIERGMARLSTALIAVSPKVKADLLKYRIAPENKIKVLYLGLELARFSAQPRRQGTLRKELRISAEQTVVGIVARLVPIKGLEIFLEAARRIAAADPTVEFVVIGDGELRQGLEKRADELGLKTRIHFLGFRNDLEYLYPDIDVLMLTSFNEGSPVSLIEGLAAGCAVVSTHVGGVPDVIRDGESGWLIAANPDDTPEAIGRRAAEKVLSLLTDPAERRRLGENGQKDVLNRFDIHRLVQDIDRLYCDTLLKVL